MPSSFLQLRSDALETYGSTPWQGPRVDAFRWIARCLDACAGRRAIAGALTAGAAPAVSAGQAMVALQIQLLQALADARRLHAKGVLTTRQLQRAGDELVADLQHGVYAAEVTVQCGLSRG